MMKNIIQDIEKLLRKHDYVIIPEFGGFVLQTQSSQFKQDTIIPPTSIISFNPLLQELDGLLAIEVSRTQNISYREAVKFISQEVLYFKRELKTKSKVSIGRLGYFSLEEDKIVFTPSANLSFMPRNYGLQSRHINKENLIDDKKSKITISFNLPNPKRVMRYVAIFTLVIGIGFLTPPTDGYYKEKGTFNLIDKFDSLLNFQTTQNKSIKLPPLTMPIEETAKFITVKNVKSTIEIENNKYQVIIASLRNKNKANRIKNIYKKDFKEIRIIENNGYFRVSIKGFNNRNRAYRFARNIKREYPQFQDTWIAEK